MMQQLVKVTQGALSGEESAVRDIRRRDLVSDSLYYSPRWWQMLGYEVDELPADDLNKEIHKAEYLDLAFVKGDANYRRLLGDRQWDYSAPFRDVVGCYFPCPVCALRTLKAEVGCGMAREQVERAMALDDEWMVNGRFGVVQFSKDQLS